MNIYNRIYRFLRPPFPGTDQKSKDLIRQMALQKGDIALDCGANIGSITGLMAQTNATVYAFEPNPYAFTKLNRTFRFYLHVHCFPHAVSNSDGLIQLHLHEKSSENPVKWSVGSSIHPGKINVNAATGIQVQSIDLAKFILNLKRPVRLIKMDIEGAEYRTLQHLIETETIHLVDQIYVEMHHERNPVFQPEFEALQALIDENNITNISTDWI